MSIVTNLFTDEKVRTALKAFIIALAGAVVEYAIGIIDALGSAPVVP